MKDEYGGTPIIEFIGSKPKSYSVTDVNNCEKNIHKGHNSNIRSNEFKDIIINKRVLRHKMKKITPKNHKMYTQENNKISLSSCDDKRYIIEDGITTLAYGHKDIPKNE